MINIIIFSKDRACQLGALLESLNDKMKIDHKVSVIYTFSESNYKNGYDILLQNYPDCNFVKETTFKDDVMALVDSDCEHVMFLVDDIVFIRNVELDSNFEAFNNNKDVLTLSLALSPAVTFEYPRQMHVKMPEIKNNTFEWVNRWKKRKNKKSNEWGAGWDCPMSVGGNIFRTKDFLPYVEKIVFYNPNTMESRMQKRPFKSKPLMMCCDKAKLIAVPINIVVENGYRNRHGETDAFTLNNKWLDGMKIDVSVIYGLEFNAIHNIIDWEFIKR